MFSRAWRKAQLCYGHQNKFHKLREYAYFLVFFTKPNFKALTHTDVQEVTLYKSEPETLMN